MNTNHSLIDEDGHAKKISKQRVIYFETFDIASIIKSISQNNFSGQKLYYIDASRFSKLFIIPFLHLLGFSLSKLDFKLTDIRDIKSNELIRERIVRDDLFLFENKVKQTEQFKNLKKSKHPSYDFILKGISDLGILEKKSISRFIFLIEVVINTNVNNGISHSVFYADKRPWMYALVDSMKTSDIILAPVKRIKVNFSLQAIPLVYLLLKYILGLKDKRNLISRENNLTMEGRGDINFKNDGRHSDFFWLLNSEFPSSSFIANVKNKSSFNLLKANGIQTSSSRLGLNSLISDYSSYQRYKAGRGSTELKDIDQLSRRYKSIKIYWKNFFKENKIKLFLSWNKYDSTHIAISDAMREIDGVTCLYQIAYDGYRAIECRIKSDVSFIFSNLSSESELNDLSNTSYQVITGYTKDYAKPLLKNSALELRKRILLNGASKIITSLDENNGSDSRWHTGTKWQQDNYVKLIDQLFKDTSLGLIFKPKHGPTLRSRLGEDVYKYIEKAKGTGRCVVLDDSLEDSYLSSAPPMLAALSSDLCIHGHFGTASIECALAGVATLIIDREVSPFHNFYKYLKKDEVIFSDWDDAIYAAKEFLNSSDNKNRIGNWENILNEMDPFCDGKGALRMGSYLSYLKEGYELGMSKEHVLERSSEKYSKKWGSDKIIFSKP